MQTMMSTSKPKGQRRQTIDKILGSSSSPNEPSKRRYVAKVLSNKDYQSSEQKLEIEPENEDDEQIRHTEEKVGKSTMGDIDYTRATTMTSEEEINFTNQLNIPDEVPSLFERREGTTHSTDLQKGTSFFKVVKYTISAPVTDTFIKSVNDFIFTSGPAMCFNFEVVTFIFPKSDVGSHSNNVFMVVVADHGRVLANHNLASFGKLLLVTAQKEHFGISAKVIASNPKEDYSHMTYNSYTDHWALSNYIENHLSFGLNTQYTGGESDAAKEIVWNLVCLHQYGCLLTMFDETERPHTQSFHYRKDLSLRYPNAVSFSEIVHEQVFHEDVKRLPPFTVIGIAVDVWASSYSPKRKSQDLIALTPEGLFSSSFTKISRNEGYDEHLKKLRDITRMVRTGFIHRFESAIAELAMKDSAAFETQQGSKVLLKFLRNCDDLEESAIVQEFYNKTKGACYNSLFESLYMHDTLQNYFEFESNLSRFSLVSFEFTTRDISLERATRDSSQTRLLKSYPVCIQETIEKMTRYVRTVLSGTQLISESLLAKITSKITNKIDEPISALLSLSPEVMMSLLICSLTVSNFFIKGGLTRDDLTIYISGTSCGGKTFVFRAIQEALLLVEATSSLFYQQFTPFKIGNLDGGVCFDEYAPDVRQNFGKTKELFSGSREGISLHLKNEDAARVEAGHVILVSGNKTPSSLFKNLVPLKTSLPSILKDDVKEFIRPVFRKSTQILFNHKESRIGGSMSNRCNTSEPQTFSEVSTRYDSESKYDYTPREEFQRLYSRLVIAWGIAFVIAQQNVSNGGPQIFTEDSDLNNLYDFKMYFEHDDVLESLVLQFKRSECPLLSAMFDPSQRLFQQSMISLVRRYATQHDTILASCIDPENSKFIRATNPEYQEFFDQVENDEVPFENFMDYAHEIDEPTVMMTQYVSQFLTSITEKVSITNSYGSQQIFKLKTLTDSQDSKVPQSIRTSCSSTLSQETYRAFFVPFEIRKGIFSSMVFNVTSILSRLEENLLVGYLLSCPDTRPLHVNNHCFTEVLTQSRVVTESLSYTAKMIELIWLFVVPNTDQGADPTNNVVTTTMLFQDLMKRVIEGFVKHRHIDSVRSSLYSSVNDLMNAELGEEISSDSNNERRGFRHWTVSDFAIASFDDVDLIQYILLEFTVDDRYTIDQLKQLSAEFISPLQKHIDSEISILPPREFRHNPLSIYLSSHPVRYDSRTSKFTIGYVEFALILIHFHHLRAILRNVILVRSYGRIDISLKVISLLKNFFIEGSSDNINEEALMTASQMHSDTDMSIYKIEETVTVRSFHSMSYHKNIGASNEQSNALVCHDWNQIEERLFAANQPISDENSSFEPDKHSLFRRSLSYEADYTSQEEEVFPAPSLSMDSLDRYERDSM